MHCDTLQRALRVHYDLYGSYRIHDALCPIEASQTIKHTNRTGQTGQYYFLRNLFLKIITDSVLHFKRVKSFIKLDLEILKGIVDKSAPGNDRGYFPFENPIWLVES